MLAVLVVAAAAAAAPAPKPPNLLLLFPDQWRWDFNELSQGEALIQTPTFAALAKRGSRFEKAYVPSPLCAPSRAALALGREYDTQQVPSNSYDVPAGVPTFYRTLRDEAGYHIMITGKDDLTKHSGYCGTTGRVTQPCLNASYRAEELGYSAWLGRTPGKLGTLGPDGGPFNAFLASSTVTLPNGSQANAQVMHDLCFGETGLQPDQHLPRSNWTCCHGAQVCDVPVHVAPEMYEDNWVGAEGLKMLLQRPSGKPWYMQVNWPGPHTPFIVTQEMMESTATRAFEPPVDYHAGPNSVEDNIVARRLYAAEVENLDRWFGRYIHAVQQLGDYASTIICISSDHGEMLGDHGDWNKEKPWEGSAHVPLVCGGPSVQTQVVAQPVTTMDLAATWLDFAGVTAMGKMVDSTSRSLVPVLHGTTAQNREFISSGLGMNSSGLPRNLTWDWRMVVKRAAFSGAEVATTLKYICCRGTCPGAPSNVPTVLGDQWQELLYDVDADWREMHPLNLSLPHWRNISEHLRVTLPPAFAAGCKNAVRPTPARSAPFQLSVRSGSGSDKPLLVAATAEQLHAPLELTADPEAAVLSHFQLGGGTVRLAANAGMEIMMKHTGGELCSDSTPVVLGPPNKFSFALEASRPDESDSTVRLRAAACSAPAMCLAAAGGNLALAPCDQPSAVFTRHTAQ